MQISKKLTILGFNFLTFLESTLNFEYFPNKNDPASLSIFDVLGSERRGFLNAKKVLFLKTLPH